MTVIALLSTSKNLQAQSTETKPQSISQMRETAKALADCQLLIREAEFLRQDTAAMHKEISRKESVILSLLTQRNMVKGMLDTMQQSINKRDEIISGQQNVIEKVSKVKRWNLSLGAGYGFNGKDVGLLIGVTLNRTILRF
jgi:hypothetical protein